MDRLHLYFAERGYKEPDLQTYCPYTWVENADGMFFVIPIAVLTRTRLDILGYHVQVPVEAGGFPSGLYDI